MNPALAALLLCGALVAAANASAKERAVPDVVLSCESCHGLRGKSEDEGIPSIAGLKQEYIARQLRAFRSGKRGHGAGRDDMPANMREMGGQLSDGDITALARHFSKLPR